MLLSGSLSEVMGDLDGALQAYEHALRHNRASITAMNQISCILRTKENFPRAVEYLQEILKLDNSNGEVWGSIGNIFEMHRKGCTNNIQGHCFLMMEDLQQAYSAYQQALYHLRDPKVNTNYIWRWIQPAHVVPGTQAVVRHWNTI